MAHDISKHPYWSHDEFTAFLLFYAANADMECTEEERQLIVDTIPENHLAEIEKEYRRLTDFEHLQVIQSYRKKYYPNAAMKQEMLKGLEKVFNADGNYDVMEHSVYLMMQKILKEGEGEG